MDTEYVMLATEDVLSECLLERILAKRKRYQIRSRLRRDGNQYLKNIAKNLNQVAKKQTVLLLTDLDRNPCPPDILVRWIGGAKTPRFLFRVAVQESESWVLASSDKFNKFLGLQRSDIPDNCDLITNPKEFLIDIARKAKNKTLREEIVPRRGGTAKKGYGYNVRLCEFVTEHWDENEAVLHSESLRRCIAAIDNL